MSVTTRRTNIGSILSDASSIMPVRSIASVGMCSAFLGGVIQGVDSVVRKFESLKIPPSSGATRILGSGPDISRMTPEVSFTYPKASFAVVRRLGYGTFFTRTPLPAARTPDPAVSKSTYHFRIKTRRILIEVQPQH